MSDIVLTVYTGLCGQILASFDEIQKKVEQDVKKELAANHDNVTKNMDKVSLCSLDLLIGVVEQETMML